MFTKIFFTAAVVLSSLCFSVSDSYANYWGDAWINGVHYKVEYNNDGSIAQVIPYED